MGGVTYRETHLFFFSLSLSYSCPILFFFRRGVTFTPRRSTTRYTHTHSRHCLGTLAPNTRPIGRVFFSVFVKFLGSFFSRLFYIVAPAVCFSFANFILHAHSTIRLVWPIQDTQPSVSVRLSIWPVVWSPPVYGVFITCACPFAAKSVFRNCGQLSLSRRSQRHQADRCSTQCVSVCVCVTCPQFFFFSSFPLSSNTHTQESRVEDYNFFERTLVVQQVCCGPLVSVVFSLLLLVLRRRSFCLFPSMCWLRC